MYPVRSILTSVQYRVQAAHWLLVRLCGSPFNDVPIRALRDSQKNKKMTPWTTAVFITRF